MVPERLERVATTVRAASSGMGLVIDCSCRVGWRRRRIAVTFEGLYKLVRRARMRPEVELSL